MKHHILIAEPDQELASQLSTLFKKQGFQVILSTDGNSAYKQALNHELDAAVLEIALPEQNGLDVVKSIREHSSLPILILSSEDSLTNKQVAFELGADDFLSKPCHFYELLSRVKAMIGHHNSTVSPKPVITFGPIHLDTSLRTMCYHDKQLEITKAEFNILELLIKSPNQAFSKQELTELALGRDFTAYDRSIDVHISNLRHKLGKTSNGEDWIKTVRGFGYLLNDKI